MLVRSPDGQVQTKYLSKLNLRDMLGWSLFLLASSHGMRTDLSAVLFALVKQLLDSHVAKTP